MADEASLTHKSLRCPKLGGDVPFHYCETLQQGMPCERIVRCWEVYADIEAYLKARYTPVEIERFLHPEPKDKMNSLLEIIEQAKKNISK